MDTCLYDYDFFVEGCVIIGYCWSCSICMMVTIVVLKGPSGGIDGDCYEIVRRFGGIYELTN